MNNVLNIKLKAAACGKRNSPYPLTVKEVNVVDGALYIIAEGKIKNRDTITGFQITDDRDLLYAKIESNPIKVGKRGSIITGTIKLKFSSI